jgi:putative nucleotidyltransferase with HDIG domain
MFERLAAASLETLLNAIDANDAETGAHVRRVARYALILARAAGADDTVQRSVERVALFHDIGKIHEALFDVIHEGDRITPAERQLIATHPQRGAEVLAPISEFYPELCESVLSHHERWDGRGYPRRLRGPRIPFPARIVAIADTFDAITHRRRYAKGRSIDEALDLIAAGRGTQFDPELIDLFLRPDIVARLRRTARAELGDGRRARGSERRGRRPDAKVPDVTFRWRSEPRERHAPDPPRRTPRESSPRRSPPPP